MIYMSMYDVQRTSDFIVTSVSCSFLFCTMGTPRPAPTSATEIHFPPRSPQARTPEPSWRTPRGMAWGGPALFRYLQWQNGCQ